MQIPRDRADRFVNWARTESTAPLRWHRPTSEDQVRQVVARAAAARRRVRVVGAGHSFSRIAAPDDEAMSLDGLAGGVRIDRGRGQVSVPAGMRLREVSARLLRCGLALPVVGSIQAQTVAGAIATGTHGSSLCHGNLATLVTGLRIITGDGGLVRLDDGDERLLGARVHLGALGVITSVSLRVRAAGRLHQTIEHVPVETVPAALQDIAASAEYVKVWWLPHAATAQIVRYHRTDAPPTRRPSARTQRWVDEEVLHRAIFRGLVAVQHRRPSLVAGINRRLSSFYLGATSQVGQDMLMLNTPMPMRHRETEAAVPLSRAAEALTGILGLFADGRPAANFPLEIRFVRRDEAWMSPASGADTCQIGAYSTNGPDCEKYFAAFWQVMRPLGARPHWGKEFDHEVAELRALYPDFDRFAKLRDELDPHRVFGGRLHRRVLGS